MDLHLPRWLAARGAKVRFLLKHQSHRRRLRLTIPAGIREGTCIKIEGGGKRQGSRRGNLYINIRLKD
jgi:DnaJ-class molecular chaperone